MMPMVDCRYDCNGFFRGEFTLTLALSLKGEAIL